jgi:uncharacterized protein (DUF1499 family)
MRIARYISAAGLGSLFLVGVTGPLHRVGFPLDWTFALMTGAAYCGVAVLVSAVPSIVWLYRKQLRLAAVLGTVGLVAGLTAFVIPTWWQWRMKRLPGIHDISTDLENPPAFSAVVSARAGAPNGLERGPAVTQQQREGYPDLAPLTLAEPFEQVLARARATAEGLGWTIVNVDERAGLLEASHTTRWFGFTDDIAVRVTPWGTGSRIDVRSVSREGRTDAGRNADRVRSFLATLQAP